MAKKFAKRAGAILLAVSMLASSMAISVNANYTMGTPVEDLPEKAPWQDNYIAPEGVDFSAETVSEMMQAIEDFDFEKFAEDNSDLPWLDELLVNEGVIPDSDANILFSRGSALYLKTHSPSSLGFVGSVYYADTLGQNSIFNVSLSGGTPSEDTSLRKNYPSHENQTFTSGNLSINQKKFITYGNTAVALYEFTNNSSEPITFTMTVKSPFTTGSEGDELVASHVACPTMIGTSGLNTVEAMSYVDVRLSGTEMTPSGNSLVREITVPAGETVDQKVVMGWLADEIPQSQEQYDEFKGYTTNDEAFAAQVKMYNEWWADNIPYIDIPDENVKKVIYYRWWCNRFNLLEANIPGNDWQFPMNMEGVLGYNNGITVSVPWAMQDLKWLRDPSYVYGTWMAQGEYSGDDNYKNNPGRPNTWTWDMMQNTSQVGWEAYKIHGGGEEILQKFADYSKYDVLGTLNRFGGSGKYENLIIYNHGPITGNDGDCIGMHWNETSSDGNYARLDGTATTYANAVAAAQMYAALGDTENQQLMEQKAEDIRNAVMENMWYDGTDFEAANGRGDGIADTNGEGSFLGLKVATGEYVPWRDNNFFVFNFRLVPSQLEAEEYPDYAKYATQLYDYADPDYYPIFPFYTADQNSILKRVESLAWDSDKTCCDHFAWCNFGNYLNTVRTSMRYYPVDNIDADVYKTLFEWGAWLNCIEEGNTDYMDSAEFFWTEDFGMDGTTESTPTGEIIRSWIHHDTLGMMDFSVIEDIAGLQAREDNKIELWPLGVDYDYFTVDNIRYHDQDLTIVWQDPAKEAHYEGIPTGFSLYIGNERVFTTNEMSHVIYDPDTGKVELPDGDVDGAAGDNSNTEILYEIGSATPVATANETSLADNEKAVDMFNKAGIDLEHNSENLAMAEGTTITSTYIDSKSDIQNVADGSTVTGGGITFTDESKKTQHTALFSGTPNSVDSIDFDFGEVKTVDNVKIYFYNDRQTVGTRNGYPTGFSTPQSFSIEYWDEEAQAYKPVTGQYRYPAVVASNYNNVEFTEVSTSKIRVSIIHNSNYYTGVKEIQIYDNDLTVTPSENTAPVVRMESGLGIEQGETLSIKPEVTDDGLPGGLLTYKWEQISGAEDGVSIVEGTDSQPVFKATFNTIGTYQFRLTVSDGELETVVEFPVTCYVPTGGLEEMMKPFETLNGRYQRNSDDFTKESWNVLQSALTFANDILDAGVYSSQDIDYATEYLRLAIEGLEYKNVALLATPSTSFVSSWENLNAVNDGYVPTTSADMNDADGGQYGNWSSTDPEWVAYTWDEPVTINSSSVYFFDDGGGVQVPGSYTLEYWDDETGAYVPVSNMSEQTLNKNAFNTVTFDEVTTTKFRITMTSGGASTGIKEWRVLTNVESTPADHGAITEIASVQVNTTVNVMPVLPEMVVVTYEDGAKGLEPVQWEEISPDKLTVATNFSILGTVEGSDRSASCLINVLYDKAALKALIDKAQALLDNQQNYEATDEQWQALESAISAAESAYNNGSATQGDINAAQSAIEDAINNIRIKDPYAAATPSASYTPTWNDVNGLNDGVWGENSGEDLGSNMWACWGAPDDPWVQYSWDIPVELSSMDIMYFDNRASDPTYNGESLEEWGGIAIPISQELYYLDENGEWVEITTDMMAEGGLATELDVFNTTTFTEPITTTAIKLQMHRNGLATGIMEWIVYSDSDEEPTVDRTELNNALAVAGELAEGAYTPASWSVLKEAVDAANALAEDADQATVDAAAKAINDAMAALIKVADRTDLESALAAAEAVTEEELNSCTPASVEVFQNAWEEAKAVNDNLDATQEQVNDAADALLAAIDGLAPVGNKALLEKTYEYALTLSTEGVTDSAVKAFEDAKTAAKAVLDDPNATQEMIDSAWDNLLEGIWALGLTQGDKTMLEQLIVKAEAMMDDADKYVQTNWQQLVDALDKANEVMADGDAMEEDVQPAAEALLNAILAQRYKADKSILNDLVNKAEAMDISGYSAESVAMFTAALQNAKVVLADATLSVDDQAVVDEAVDELNNAIENLSADTNEPSGDEDKDDSATSKPGNSEEDSSDNSASDGAQTGDMTPVLPVAVVAVIAAAGIVLIWKKRKVVG